MDVNSFLGKLRSQTWFHRSDKNPKINGPSDQHNPLDKALNKEDQVDEDDYLIVGQTMSERNAVLTESFNASLSPDRPPTYRQVSDDYLPPYSSVLSGECQIVSGPPSLNMFSSVQFSADSEQTQSYGRENSSVADVPFEFHPSLRTKQQVEAMFSRVDLQPKQFSWEKYSHDFMNEKLCLRDLSSVEVVDIEEFLSLRLVDESLVTSVTEEVDLIQL